jgi:hypothetical protein
VTAPHHDHAKTRRYWWVNHGQTVEHEVAGGYLWSPKCRQNGTPNRSYDFMREISPGDIVFSYGRGRIGAVGVARSSCYESALPEDITSVGSTLGRVGWRADVSFSERIKPIHPKEHIANLRTYLPERYSPLTTNGFGSQMIYLTEISPAFAGAVSGLIGYGLEHGLAVGLPDVASEQDPRVVTIPASAQILSMVRVEPALIRELGAEDLEILVCDRLEKMGFICIRTGPTHKPDGGIDIIACPQEAVQFPYLLAVQVKSHRSGQPTPVKAVRDFVGALQSQPFQAGVIVTNTNFTFDARWFAEKQQHLIHLRDFHDLSCWVRDKFAAREFWREIPQFVELRPGVTIQVPDALRRAASRGR